MKPQNILCALGCVSLLLVCASPLFAQIHRFPQYPEPQELASLGDASVKELLHILSQPEKHVRVADNTAAGAHMVSLWDRASSLLSSQLDEARPLLADMLNSETADTRANAIRLLMLDDAENLGRLIPDFTALLADPTARVRVASARILAKLKNAKVEIALLAALSKADAKRPRSAEADNELRAIIGALCTEPLSEDKVVPVLARLLDESHSSSTIIWTTMQASTRLARSEGFGTELIERYWHILSTTEDNHLPYIATAAMGDSDGRTLAYLRKTGAITNSKARGYAAAELVSHSDFDPEREKDLFESLLGDKSPWVRVNVIVSLCMRAKGVDPNYQISTALKMCDADRDDGVRKRALAGVFDVLHRVPKALRADILEDRDFSLPDRMTDALGNDTLRDVVVYQTGKLAGENWHPRDGTTAVNKTLSWWQEKKDESP